MTISRPITQKMNVDSVCPKCNERVEIKDIQVPPVSVPSTTFPYAQKIFDIKGKFALAVYGSAFVNLRSMFSHVLSMTAKLPEKSENDAEDYLSIISEEIKKYFDNQLKLEWQKTGTNVAMLPDTWFPFGFQLAGIAKDADGEPVARVYNIQIGKQSAVVLQSSPALCTGDTTVVRMLWPNGNPGANFGIFSLQDAIDYAKFLIRTTADYQRFSGQLPVVGGEVDIALVTPRRGFKWIAQKELYRLLDK
jgi:hypothetical protein